MPASLFAALAIPLLGLLPGLLLLRRIGGLHGPGRSQDGNRADRWIETLVLATGVSILLSGWLALILAELEVFSLSLLLLVEALIGGVLLVPIGRGKQQSTSSGARGDTTGAAKLGSRSVESSPRLTWPNGRELTTLGAGLAVAMTLGSVYLYPSEHVLGGQDPGVYVVTGAIIAQTGGIVIHDHELAELSPAGLALLFPDPPVRFAEGSRQIGLYLTDSARGRVVPHGLHYYPAAIAVMVALGGLPWGLATGGLFTLLGVAMVGLAAKEAFGRATGLLAAALLSVNVAQVWFARYPAAEPLAQLQLWLGLFALTRMLRECDRLPVSQQRLFAALAGWSLGLLLLTKVELVVVPAVVVGFLWYLGLTGRFRPAYWWLLATYSVVALHALFHYSLIATWYVYSALTLDRYGVALASISVLGGLIAGGSLTLRTRLGPVALSLERYGARFTTVATVAIAGAATYAYFLRPIGAAGQPDFVVNNQESFVRLGWYVSPLGLASSVAGVGRALIGAGLVNVPLLLVSLGETVLHLVDARVTPIHFWAFRRFHPVALPTIAVFAGVLIVYLANERRSLRALAYTLGGGLMVWSAVVSAPILSHREYAGAPAALSAFRAELDANAVALYEWRGESFRLALPLQHLLGLTGYLVPPKGTDDPRLVDLVRSQVERGRTVYWVSVGGERDGLRRRFEVEPVTTHAWQWPEWEARTNQRPERLSALSIVIDVLRLQPLERERSDRRMLEFLDVGERDESGLGEGFGPSASLAGCASCRRLTGRAEIRLAEPSQVDLELSLGLAGGRQPNAPLARVAIGVNGRRLGSRTLSNDFRTYYFDLRGVQPGVPVVVSIETEPDGWSGPGIGVDWARLTAPS